MKSSQILFAERDRLSQIYTHFVAQNNVAATRSEQVYVCECCTTCMTSKNCARPRSYSYPISAKSEASLRQIMKGTAVCMIDKSLLPSAFCFLRSRSGENSGNRIQRNDLRPPTDFFFFFFRFKKNN